MGVCAIFMPSPCVNVDFCACSTREPNWITLISSECFANASNPAQFWDAWNEAPVDVLCDECRRFLNVHCVTLTAKLGSRRVRLTPSAPWGIQRARYQAPGMCALGNGLAAVTTLAHTEVTQWVALQQAEV